MLACHVGFTFIVAAFGILEKVFAGPLWCCTELSEE